MKHLAIRKLLQALPLLPLLLAGWFVLTSFSTNQSELRIDVLVMPLLFVTALSMSLYALIQFFMKNLGASALLTSWVMAVLLGYGHLQDLMSNSSLPSSNKLLVLILGICTVVLFFIISRFRGNYHKTATVIGIVVGLLVIYNSVLIGMHQISIQSTSTIASTDEQAASSTITATDDLPDVYYIVPDRYTNNDVWQSDFDFDNQDFLNTLTSRDFKVYENAYSNYQWTGWSVSSTLDMRYLEKEQELDNKTTDLNPIYTVLQDNQTIRTFKDLGYKYYLLGSWWQPTRESPLADKVYHVPLTYTYFHKHFHVSEFSSQLIGASMARIPLKDGLYFKGMTVAHASIIDEEVNAKAFQYQLEALQEIRNLPGPKFVFIHYLMPHPPFTFLPDGTTITYDSSTLPHEQYINQLKYANSVLLQQIDALQSQEKPPVILIQADEGAYPGEGIDRTEIPDGEWEGATDNQLRLKFGILRALYFPNQSDLPDTLASVNLFRFTLNTLFGSNLEFLPEKHFIVPGKNKPYHFIDITNRLP